MTDQLNEAWQLMCDAGLKFSERYKIKTVYYNEGLQNDPFVLETVDGFYSKHEAINSLLFKNRHEVVLANAMYEALPDKDNFNMNEFIQQLKMTMRILQLDSEWAK